MFGKIKWGIHPDTHKTATERKAIEIPELPKKVILPVRQHIGAPCTPIVKKGDTVKKGQLIASAGGAVSSNVHATISGTVVEISDQPHPSLGKCLAIIIENDGLDQWAEGVPTKREWENLNHDELIDIIKDAGIVGLGGATFPVHIKLTPPKDSVIDTLIINAAECEPYLTADHRIMLEYTERVVTGVAILKKILAVNHVIIGIENNKLDAVKTLGDAFNDPQVDVVAVPTKYPHGSEKMLIKTLLNREVPSGKLPLSVGVVVQNVGTAVAVCDAVRNGIPLIERIVTVSGSAIKEPKNLLLRIGTLFSDAIAHCGGFKFAPDKIIMGGPFMGMAQYSIDVPVIKGTNGILALSKNEVNSGPQSPCIRCGRCVEGCPMGLNPSMLSILSEKGFFDEALDTYHLLDCMECGCCSYVCPAKRKIVHFIRYAKKMSALKGAKK
ncbi:electron transport complex subunit RsxC [Desulfitobacterium metallireducens]|uniref:Ion-translocating oxidoreductase complex subunit C n=1 Tax=Desulfitobacterium metallireducens DSM 15288 TaxID=871968 RepID=W0EDH9_9FIRM|nr:electron transport complex subunit RsxC [Desulfitobacterium metallireducens]AHF07234.1 electron transporter RnfC [Desulfitobacterium metallireducens DSM 15288]